MGKTRSLAEDWFGRQGRSTRDLYALGMLAIAVKGDRAVVVPGIIGVLLLATFTESDWFKKRPAAKARRGESACSRGQGL
jgi:hypothetical protein